MTRFSFIRIQNPKAFLFLVLISIILVQVPLLTNAQAIGVASLDNFVYKQDFNSLPVTNSASIQNGITLPGWYLSSESSANITADNGSRSTSGKYSYGSTSALDRSLGSNNGSSYKFIMKNMTGSVIHHFKVSYRVEIWRKTTSASESIKFSYAQAPQFTPGVTYQETSVLSSVTGLLSDVLGLLTGLFSTNVDGNVQFIKESFIIKNVNLPVGNEIRFNWTGPSSSWGLGIDEVEIEPIDVIKFYNKTGADFTSMANWGINLDGSGIQPGNFLDAYQVFHIQNYPANATLKLSQIWGIGGAGSKIVLGNGTTPVTLQVLNNQSYAGNPIDVADHATLSIDANTCPKLGTISPLSTIVFGRNAPADIMEGDVFGTVIFDSAKKNRFNNKVKIKGKLELRNAKLDLGDNDLEMDYGSAIVNGSASNYVVVSGKGRLRQGIRAGSSEVTFPVGNTTYNPVKIKLAAGSQDDIFSVSVIDGVYGSYTNDIPQQASALSNQLVNKTWIINEEVKGGSNISLSLSWNATEVLTGFNAANCHVKHYENGIWDDALSASATASGTSFSISRSDITSFSPFTVSSAGPAVLPVELLHFDVKAIANNTVKVSWKTAMEKNNDFYAVERSADGKNFNTIARVNGAGTTNNLSNYSYTDNNPLAGTSYYRLRQIDEDGSVHYLPIRSVTQRGQQSIKLSVYPNPAVGGEVNLLVQGIAKNEVAMLLITDMMGKRVHQQRLQPEGGAGLTMDGLQAGHYLVSVISKAGSQTQKLMVK